MSKFSKIQDALISAKRSELAGLFSESAYDTLNQNLETLVDEHPQDKIIKLLWCYAQASFNTLPLPFVASNLNELFEDKNVLLEAPRLSYLIADFVSQNLKESGELRSSILLLNNFLSDSTNNFFENLDEFKKSKTNILTTIDEEITSAIKRREPNNYINSLEEIKRNISSIKTPKFTKNKEKSSEIINNPPAKDTIINETSQILSLNKPPEEFILGVTNSKNLVNDTNINKKSQWRWKLPATLSFSLLIICIAALVAFQFNHFSFYLNNFFKSNNVLANKLIFETKLDNENNPITPELPPFSLDSLSPTLDDINKRLEKLNSKETPKAESTPIIDDSEIESLNNVPDKSTPNETQSTNSPVPKLPLPTTNIGKAENLGSSGKGTNLSGNNSENLKQGPDGRIFGPPQIIDPASGRKQERSLDGSPLQSYEVERYDPPKIYETITATNVLSAPSLMSQTITRLKSDTPIHVTATMGLWLELRSNEGRVGYIFAQDAIENNKQEQVNNN